MKFTPYVDSETRLLDSNGRELGRVWKFGPRHWRHSRLSMYDKGDTTLKASKAELEFFVRNGYTGFA